MNDLYSFFTRPEGIAALTAMVGLAGAFLRVLPQSESRPSDMPFSKTQVEIANGRTDLWVPLAAEIERVISGIETEPEFASQLQWERYSRDMTSNPLFVLNIRKVGRMARQMHASRPKPQPEKALLVTEAVERLVAAAVSEGRSILMPPRVLRRLEELREFVGDARSSERVQTQTRVVLRGSDALMDGFTILGASYPVKPPTFLQSVWRTIYSLPTALLMVAWLYASMIIFVISLGLVQSHSVVRASSIQNAMFAGTLLTRLRTLLYDIRRLNAG